MCAQYSQPDSTLNSDTGCLSIINDCKTLADGDLTDSNELQIHVLSAVARTISRGPLRCLLQLHNVPFKTNDGLGKLRRELKKYITCLKKGKRAQNHS